MWQPQQDLPCARSQSQLCIMVYPKKTQEEAREGFRVSMPESASVTPNVPRWCWKCQEEGGNRGKGLTCRRLHLKLFHQMRSQSRMLGSPDTFVKSTFNLGSWTKSDTLARNEITSISFLANSAEGQYFRGCSLDTGDPQSEASFWLNLPWG